MGFARYMPLHCLVRHTIVSAAEAPQLMGLCISYWTLMSSKRMCRNSWTSWLSAPMQLTGKHPYLMCNGAYQHEASAHCLLVLAGPLEKMTCLDAILQRCAFATPCLCGELQ